MSPSAPSTVVDLTREQARRIAVRAQLLALPRPTDVLEVVKHLTLLQLDPTKAVAPSAHLVLWSRLGSGYDREDLEDALTSGALVEIGGMARPAGHVRLHRTLMAAWPHLGAARPWQEEVVGWIEDNAECHRAVLEALRQEGPLPAPRLPDLVVRPWRSTGWTNDKSLLKLLDLLAARGEVCVVGREGGHRLWDLAERVYPDDPVPPLAEAVAELGRLRLRALGVARARSAATPGEPDDVGDAGQPARVEGVRGAWRVDPRWLEDDAWQPRTALLSPLDRLVMDRKRMADLFGFDYQLEMYKPAARRRFGYWALPVLHGDRLVGKVDCTAEPAEGVLRVDAVHEDPVDDQPWSAQVRGAVHAEVEDLARWLGVEPLLMPGVRR